MADVNEKVMKMVEDEIKKNPSVATSDLFQKATKVDKSIEKLSPRQFNARYPLQVKRRMSPPRRGRAGGPRRRRARGANRDAIRGVLLQFAQDLAGAEGKGDVVKLIAGIDKVVDRVEKAASSR